MVIAHNKGTGPLGILDSGSGGLSIFQSVRQMLPGESVVYIGDHAHSPYGEKPPAYIKDRVVRLIDYLLSQESKLIIIACNTATVSGVDYFRQKFPQVPIVGVVPVVKTAANISKKRSFVVLSTSVTAKSPYQKKLIDEWASDCNVISIGSAKLVPLIEEGKLSGGEIQTELNNIFSAIPKGSFDVVALGCTHYPFIRSAIQNQVGADVAIIDSSNAVARQVDKILLDRSQTQHKNTYVTTGDAQYVSNLFTKLLGEKIEVSHVQV